MKEITKVAATEQLLKVYFFKLYARKRRVGDLRFNEDQLNSLLISKSSSQLTSSELFSCCFISRRSGDEDFSNYTPREFYFFGDTPNPDVTIEEHPFLYTAISSLNHLPLYEANIGYWYLGSDLVNTKGNILLSVSPNLYDDGFYDIIASPEKLILVYEFDDNNADFCSVYSYDENANKLIPVKCVENRNYVLSMINEHHYPIILSLASEEIRNDKEIALAAVSIDDYYLRFIADSLQNDKDILAAVKKNK